MSYSFLVNIVETVEQLFEVESASSLIESTAMSNIIVELTTFSQLEGNADSWDLRTVLFLDNSVLGEFINVHYVGMIKFGHGLNFVH